MMVQHKQPTDKADEIIRAFDQRQFKNWYENVRHMPLIYALKHALVKLPFVFLFVLLLQWKKTWAMLQRPWESLQERWPYLIFLFISALVYYLVNNRNTALRYYYTSFFDASLPRLGEDEPTAVKARRRVAVIERKYDRWGHKKLTLMVGCALLITVGFFSVLYLLQGLKNNTWSWTAYMDTFESGAFLLVAAIFLLLGTWMGYMIWWESKDFYQLVQKYKAARER